MSASLEPLVVSALHGYPWAGSWVFEGLAVPAVEKDNQLACAFAGDSEAQSTSLELSALSALHGCT